MTFGRSTAFWSVSICCTGWFYQSQKIGHVRPMGFRRKLSVRDIPVFVPWGQKPPGAWKAGKRGGKGGKRDWVGYPVPLSQRRPLGPGGPHLRTLRPGTAARPSRGTLSISHARDLYSERDDLRLYNRKLNTKETVSPSCYG